MPQLDTFIINTQLSVILFFYVSYLVYTLIALPLFSYLLKFFMYTEIHLIDCIELQNNSLYYYYRYNEYFFILLISHNYLFFKILRLNLKLVSNI
jgi:hypothetical protein